MCHTKRRYFTEGICLCTHQHVILKADMPVNIIGVIGLALVSMRTLLQIRCMADVIAATLTVTDNINVNNNNKLFIIKALAQQPKGQLEAQQKA